jgi:hypothetical protein
MFRIAKQLALGIALSTLLAGAAATYAMERQDRAMERGDVHDRGRGRGASDDHWRHHPEGDPGDPREHVPELDVAAVGIVATMIAGGGMLLTRRRES